jgi:cyanate permease
VLWGLGASLGFPVGMSAGADDPARSAARVAVVSSIGYVAFLAGPPVVGLLADAVGLLEALTVVAVAAAVGMSVATAARPLR